MIVAGFEFTSTTSYPSDAQSLASLRPRIVELASLPNHNRPRADNHNLLDVSPFRHDRFSALRFVRVAKAAFNAVALRLQMRPPWSLVPAACTAGGRGFSLDASRSRSWRSSTLSLAPLLRRGNGRAGLQPRRHAAR